jgi:DNA-binding MarR family transcriptional regulator
MVPKAQGSSTEDGPTLQGKAWRAILEGHRDIARFLEQEFRRGAGLEAQYYDVMLHVSEGEGGRRMTDLADKVVLSKSGLTALVDRMESEGFVERRPDPDDRRATRIVLTPLGEERFAQASRHHRGVVRRVFTSIVDKDEAAVIVDVLNRVRQAIEG